MTPPSLRQPSFAWLDGPVGTLLETMGVPTPSPAWSALALRLRPEAVAATHAAWWDVGAGLHTASTFRTTPDAVGGLASRWTALAVHLARRAVPRGQPVLGSLAPLGDCWSIAPMRRDAPQRYADQAARLAAAGVDGILVETFLHADEARTATRAAAATGLPVWTSLTPGYAPEHPSVPSTDTLRSLRLAGADVLLMNCGPLAQGDAWAERLATSGGPWGLYVNLFDTSPEAFAAAAQRW